MALYTHHLPQWKRDEVEEIKTLSENSSLVGLVDLHGIPAKQLQEMRRDLRGRVVLKMTRNTLIREAFTELGGDVGSVKDHLDGQSALIFADENPFKLFKSLEQTKTKMYAKPGDVVPEDVVISKGPTSFKPGPIVGELQQVGIPSAIEKGKVVIRETKTFLKAGDTVNKKQADALAKLDIKTIDVGLNLQIAFFEGSFYEPSTLAIDETAYYNNVVTAAAQAFNLSVNAAIPTATTIEAIIGKATGEARNLGVEAAVYTGDLIEMIIGRAQRETLAIQGIAENNAN